jgi:hypothetical protein
MMAVTQHELLDGVALEGRHPATSHIPTRAEKAGLGPGDYVKIGFVLDEETGQSERVWVHVDAVSGERIVGVLDDDPVYAPASFGDRIELELRHVLGIER